MVCEIVGSEQMNNLLITTIIDLLLSESDKESCACTVNEYVRKHHHQKKLLFHVRIHQCATDRKAPKKTLRVSCLCDWPLTCLFMAIYDSLLANQAEKAS